MYDLVTPLPESRPPSTAPSNGAGKSSRTGGSSARNANANANATSSSSRSGQNNNLSATSKPGRTSTSPYPHSLKPSARRATNDQAYLGHDGFSTPPSLSLNKQDARTPIDPLMLGVSSGVPGAGGGTGRSPSPSAASAVSSAMDGREGDDRSTAGGSGNGASLAISIMPARAWASPQGREMSNLAFDSEGEWVGCIAGSRLSVLKV